ncbi:hypothetical protein [Fervidibacter sacchari]|jgi:hypothetical protein
MRLLNILVGILVGAIISSLLFALVDLSWHWRLGPCSGWIGIGIVVGAISGAFAGILKSVKSELPWVGLIGAFVSASLAGMALGSEAGFFVGLMLPISELATPDHIRRTIAIMHAIFTSAAIGAILGVICADLLLAIAILKGWVRVWGQKSAGKSGGSGSCPTE